MKISCFQWVRAVCRWYADHKEISYDGKAVFGDHYVAKQLGCTLSGYEAAQGDDLITLTFKDPKLATFFAMKYL